MSQINTISEFLLQAGTDFRVFDMARGIRQCATQDFLEIENATVSAPFPRQQHVWFGILFFNKKLSNEQYIWFVKLPLDEQGLVISAARQQFLHIVVDALGQSLDKQQQTNNQLPENPFTFVPNQQQLADFNSMCKMELALPLSNHLQLVKDYLQQPEQIDWQKLPLQGIADFTAALDLDDHKTLLLEQFFKLAPNIQHALCTSLENHPIDQELSALLIQWQQQHHQDEQVVSSTLRALCQSQAQSQVKQFVRSLLDSGWAANDSVLMLIAARHWQLLTDDSILAVYVEHLAANQAQLFVGLFPDLVQIPQLRDKMLGILRWPQKSPALAQAIGQLFGQPAP